MLQKHYIISLKILSLIIITSLIATGGFNLLVREKVDNEYISVLPVYGVSVREINTNNTAETLIVSDYQTVKNTREVWTKNIRVEAGGELVFDSVDVKFDVSASPIIIDVSAGGVLRIMNGTSFDLNELEGCLGYFIDIKGELYVENSTITWAGYTTTPNSSSCTDPPIEWNYGPGIHLMDGKAFINGSTIQNSTYGILHQDGALFVHGSTFTNNYQAIYNFMASGMTLEGVRFQDNFYAVYSVGSSELVLDDCIFYENYLGVFLQSSELELRNSTLQVAGSGGVMVYYDSSLIVTGSVLASEENENPENYNMFMEDSTLVMTDSLSANGLWGLYLQNCTADIENSEFLDNKFAGIYAFESDLALVNSTVFGSELGVLIENSTAELSGNEITDNHLGVLALSSQPVIENNLITRNFDYGIEAQDSSFTLGSGNNFSDADNKTNGYGILRQSCTVYVRVFDGYENILAFANISIKDSKGVEIENDTLYIKSDSGGGKLVLTRKWIDNSGVEHDEGPYGLTVFWGKPEWGGYITTTKSVDCSEGGSQQVELVLNLPDLYIIADEISISSSRPKEGKTVGVTIPVHTTGGLSPTDVSVTLFVNDKYITVKKIDSFNGSQTYELVVPLEVEADAVTGQFRVRAEVKNREYEVNYYLTPYSTNNSATAAFSVKEGDDDVDGLSYFIKFAFFAFAIIVFMIVVVLVMKVFFTAKPGDVKKEEEAEEKEEGENGGKKEEPASITDNPPEMVRKL